MEHLIGGPQLIIVGEPTAGLDPQERSRFLNLLAEIGEHVVVVLSTHILQMAILAGGRVLRSGAPQQAIDELRGHTWKKIIARDELPTYQAEHTVISTRLVGGRTVIHVFAEAAPGGAFVAVEPDLEDVCFTTLARSGPGAPSRATRQVA